MSTTQSHNLFQHLPPPAECLALIIGTLELLPFGILGLHDPAGFADGYGLPITSSSTSSSPSPSSSTKTSTSPSSTSPIDPSERTKHALARAIAARNIQNGILLLTFGAVLRDRKSLGVVVLAGLVATVADTVLVWKDGVSEKVWGHVVGVVNCGGLGGWLLVR